MLNNKDDIEAWLNKYIIKKYTINDNLTVDVEGDVYLHDKYLTSIDVNFNNITGSFDCSMNQLTSLNGSPKFVGGQFDCSTNQLTSLEEGPQLIGEDFHCNNNLLTTLKGSPKSVRGYFSCVNNQLTSLEGCPQSVGDFNCGNNPILNLNDFDCQFKENFIQYGFIIEEVKDYYINNNNALELHLSYNELQSILLYDKFNSNVEQKNDYNKKTKI